MNRFSCKIRYLELFVRSAKWYAQDTKKFQGALN